MENDGLTETLKPWAEMTEKTERCTIAHGHFDKR